MKILSTNIASPVTFVHNGKEVTTGIYKKPTDAPLYLTKNEVLGDEISDRLHHGGYYKACYVFSEGQYAYWKDLYPDLEWNWGMFGENLTLKKFDESAVYVGDIYAVGDALVQVSQPREPCYKFAHKFGTNKVLKEFITHGYGGTYLSILEEGAVKTGDKFTLIKREENSLTVAQLFNLLFAKEKDQDLLKLAAYSTAIPQKKRLWLQSFIK